MGCLQGVIIIFLSLISALFLKFNNNNRVHIHDYYYINKGGEYGEGYYLWTNPGYNNSPFIENLKSVSWNKQYIVAEQMRENEIVWFIVKASRTELMAGNDSIIGPLTIDQKDSLLYIYTPGIMRNKKFKYSRRHRYKYSNHNL